MDSDNNAPCFSLAGFVLLSVDRHRAFQRLTLINSKLSGHHRTHHSWLYSVYSSRYFESCSRQTHYL